MLDAAEEKIRRKQREVEAEVCGVRLCMWGGEVVGEGVVALRVSLVLYGGDIVTTSQGVLP